MRKIVLFISVSLDGYFEGPNRELDWNVINDEFLRHVNDVLREMSVFLEGRVTYELMHAYWPTADQDPAATETVLDFAGIWRKTPKYVFSRTLQETGEPNATILREVVPEQIEQLKSQPGGDMVVGGPDLLKTFLALNLVDEMRIYVHPVILGRGHRLFSEAGAPRSLRLLETRTFSNGIALLHYEVQR
jgi:dihydrofolate reductase